MDRQSSEVFNMKLNCYMLNQSFEMLNSIFIHLFHCFCNHYWGFFLHKCKLFKLDYGKMRENMNDGRKIWNPQIFIYFDIVMQMFVQIWKIWWNFSDDVAIHVCLCLCLCQNQSNPFEWSKINWRNTQIKTSNEMWPNGTHEIGSTMQRT